MPIVFNFDIGFLKFANLYRMMFVSRSDYSAGRTNSGAAVCIAQCFPTNPERMLIFVIPADTVLDGVDLSFVDVPCLTYHADPTDKYGEIELAKATSRELELLSRMLERPFSEKLSARRAIFGEIHGPVFFECGRKTLSNPLIS